MKNEFRVNFEEKLRLLSDELVISFESDFEALLSRHSAEGMLRSGKTIKATMKLISKLDRKLYTEVILYIDSIKLEYYSSLEVEFSNLVESAKKCIEPKVLIVFQKCTTIAGKPELYERFLLDIVADNSAQKANFHNQLSLKVTELKNVQTKSSIEKGLWVFEILVMVSLIFISGMWFNDPDGNYEPLIIGLSFLLPLIYLLIRRTSKQ